ncbi:MAG: adenosylhomocysteinase, partial [Planctomycetota bacterium]
RGMGAIVIVTEVDAVKALEASMDGFAVMPMAQAARVGELFVTLTGNKSVIRAEHFRVMKDRAVVANSGHFNVELDIPGLKRLSKKVNRNVRNHVDEYILKNNRRIYLLAEGRLINLAAAEGHPASVMDMSFATQALEAEYVMKKQGKLAVAVHDVPIEIEQRVSKLKLKSMSIGIDKLTAEQIEYLASSGEGT